jgi:hypothetical protein
VNPWDKFTLHICTPMLYAGTFLNPNTPKEYNNIYHLPYLIFIRSIYPDEGHTQGYVNLKNIPYSFLNICKKYLYPKSNVFGYVDLKN